MTDRCPASFDETLISGYIDGELTQAAEQRVRIHLEDCTYCRGLIDELRTLREAAMSTEFSRPDDSQWDERPKTGLSLAARGTGWVVAIIWAVALAGFALWQFWQGSENLMERFLVFGGLSALVLLFLSVLLDRLRTAQTDPYREVEK
ncbi:MAG: zf-HC2 domain-containing protein [Acidobacteria bacterium]|jgi:predicted anti-sigma-YlaC factor YlaD|nr:zf-HC2 domain-containing protein [Acidobacteriota bacterium]